MAEKAATPGTAFHGPVYVVDEDLDVVGTVAVLTETDIEYEALAEVGDTSMGDESTDINANFAAVLALISEVAAAVGITVTEAE